MEQYKIVRDDRGMYPMGFTRMGNRVHLSVAAEGENCWLILYHRGKKEPCGRVEFPKEEKVGDVWGITLEGEHWDRMEYCFEVDGIPMADPYGIGFSGRENWGDFKQAMEVPRAKMTVPDFDWEEDRPLETPYEDMILYRLHPRGFTKHTSSKVKKKGTFQGIMEKIPYLKELGVTAVEILPPVEFSEVVIPKRAAGNPYGKPEPTGKINYWGYAPALYFSPKAAYCGERHGSPDLEMKQLVKAFHKNGMELVIELYFEGEESPAFVLDVLRFWVREYHVDGIHLVGNVPASIAASDPYLSRTKLFATAWDGGVLGKRKHLAEYNDGFLVDMRRLLKGDEDQLAPLMFRNKRNPGKYGVINYMANTNGFTMMDMVSYDQKHNEANGEDNRDGSDYNYSWNCGVEGPSRKKKLVKQRHQQLRNAFVMLFLSQGTPLLLAGDEFGNSKNGNNNSYCQDNEISWLNWNLLKTNRDIYEFVKYMIAFRKAHPVFHMETEPMNVDYMAFGVPDVSYHGVNAWRPELENYRRQLGIMYCGDYGKCADNTADDDFYVAYNMHWEAHKFALPKAAKKKQWHLVINTENEERNGIYPEGEEELLEDQKILTVPPRSIMVLIGKTLAD